MMCYSMLRISGLCLGRVGVEAVASCVLGAPYAVFLIKFALTYPKKKRKRISG